MNLCLFINQGNPVILSKIFFISWEIEVKPEFERIFFRKVSQIRDLCYKYLKPKRKYRSIIDLKSNLVTQGYIAFSEEELLKSLIQDRRFIVDKAEDLFSAKIRVVRKKDLGCRRP